MFEMSEEDYMSCNNNTAMIDSQQLQNSSYQGDPSGTSVSISAIISASCVLVDGTDHSNIHNHHSFPSQHLTSQQQNNFTSHAWPQPTSGQERPEFNVCPDRPDFNVLSGRSTVDACHEPSGLNICQERTDFNFCSELPDCNIFLGHTKDDICPENPKFNVCCREPSSYDYQFENGSKNSDHLGPSCPYNNDHPNKTPIVNMQNENKDFVSGQYLSQPFQSIWREGQYQNGDFGDNESTITREFERDLNITSLHQYGGKGNMCISNSDQMVSKEFTMPQYLDVRSGRHCSRQITPAPIMTSTVSKEPFVSMVENSTSPIKTVPSSVEPSLPMIMPVSVESSQIMAAQIGVEPSQIITSHSRGDKMEMTAPSEMNQKPMLAPTSSDQIQLSATRVNTSSSEEDRAWLEGPIIAPESNSTMSGKIDIDVDHMLSKGVTVAGYKPRPIIRKKRKKAVVQEQKNIDYWNRRIKNNDSARKSREAKKEKERIFYKQALQLEYENYFLKVKISQLESQLGIAPSQQNLTSVEVLNTEKWN